MKKVIPNKGLFSACLKSTRISAENGRPKCHLLRTGMFMFILTSMLLSMNVHSQTLNLSFRNTPFKNAIETIGKQGRVDFVFDNKFIQIAKPVTLDAKNMALNDVLQLLFKDQPFHFNIKDGIVYIIPAQKGNPVTTTSIHGRVNGPGGKPLEGVTISIKDKPLSTLTDKDGQYTLSNVAKGMIVQFTSIGYKSVEKTVSGDELNVTLELASEMLTTVEVNAGYWKVADKLRTGSISKVSGETVRQSPVSDPILSLAGRVPGLQITQTSGLPGSVNQIRIRGTNSIANGNDPLILVDGIPFNANTPSNPNFSGASQLSPLSLLNAAEIESIEVLRDADATAVYGSRGANGVILITTKKGKSGPTRVNIDAYSGFGKVTRMMDLLNTEQYIEMRKEAFKNDGVTVYPSFAYDVNGTWDQTRYTDWQKELIGGTSHISNIQLQVSGGSEQTQFTFGGGWMRESTVMPGKNDATKGSGNLSITHRSANNRFGVSASIRYLQNITDQPITDLATQIFLPPNAPAIYDANGKLNWENNTWYNPFAYLLPRAVSNTKNLLTNASFDYYIIKGLQGKLNLGYSDISMLEKNTTPITASDPSNANRPTLRRLQQATNDLSNWIIEPQLNYNREIGEGKLEVTLGSTFQKNTQQALSINANNFTDDALIGNLAAATTISIRRNLQTEYKYTAIFGRLHFRWQDKYLINLTARRDGSSRFAPERKFGNFGSVGAGWIFSKENFIPNNILSFGKLRASYGVTGNDQLLDYQYFDTYTPYSFPYLGVTGLSPSRIYSPDYGWESVKKLEAAIDLGFLNDRIRFTAAFYRNRTTNQLVGYPLPTMTGFATITANLPATIENRGWELELNTVNVKNKVWTWTSNVNLSIPRNKLVAYPELSKSAAYRNRFEVGKSLGVFRGFLYNGVDPNTGYAMFDDRSKDGKLSSPDDLYTQFDTYPQYLGGISNSIQFKSFQFDFLVQYVDKMGYANTIFPGVAGNQPISVLNRWQKPGDITDVPQYSSAGNGYNALAQGIYSSNLLFDNASFWRLRNLSLSYNMPEEAAKAILAKNCRIYVLAQNLFTITNYRGIDPETGSNMPAIRMVTAGVNITF